MLGARGSSRDTEKALSIINAVGDQGKKKILEEIKKAQQNAEKILSEANQTKREAEQAQKAAEEAQRKTKEEQNQLAVAKIRFNQEMTEKNREITEQQSRTESTANAVENQIQSFEKEKNKILDNIETTQRKLDARESTLKVREAECAKINQRAQSMIAEFTRIGELINKAIK